jgi:glycosyltransferase involved in cell wall biosynthesis
LSTKKGQFYSRLERAMMNRTELFLFESAFARNTFQRTIGIPKGVVRCVFNGVTAKEFEPLATAEDATDVAYVGEFRHIKGADIVIDAVARLRAGGRPVTLTLGGDGEEMQALKARCERHGLATAVRFLGHVPARTGFAKGRLLVVPSRGDSMPYVVIEAAAAGIPILAAKTGGIPEILGPNHPNLVAPDNVPALADAIAWAIDNPLGMRDRANALRERVQAHFSQTAMVEGILTAYADAFSEQ